MARETQHMQPVQCTRCGLLSPPGSERCECGFVFTDPSSSLIRRSVPGSWKRLIGSAIVLYLGIALIVGGLRPPIIPELITDGAAMILSAVAYRSRKRTLMHLRRFGRRRRWLEYAAICGSVGEMMLRPPSPRYHYNLAFNLVFSVGTIAMYAYLVLQERRAGGKRGFAA
jgi:hypothetical protein